MRLGKRIEKEEKYIEEMKDTGQENKTKKINTKDKEKTRVGGEGGGENSKIKRRRMREQKRGEANARREENRRR